MAAGRLASRTSLYLACCAKKHLATGRKGGRETTYDKAPANGRTDGGPSRKIEQPGVRKQPRHPPPAPVAATVVGGGGRGRIHLRLFSFFLPTFPREFAILSPSLRVLLFVHAHPSEYLIACIAEREGRFGSINVAFFICVAAMQRQKRTWTQSHSPSEIRKSQVIWQMRRPIHIDRNLLQLPRLHALQSQQKQRLFPRCGISFMHAKLCRKSRPNQNHQGFRRGYAKNFYD